MKKSDKKSFITMLDLHDTVKMMNDEEAGKLLKAELAYWREEEYELPRDLSFAFCAIKNQFDRDWEKWVAICEKNKSNGKKGGRPKNKITKSKPKNPVGYSETEANPENPEKDKDKDKDKDTGNGKKKKNNDYSPEFIHAMSIYPPRAGGNPKGKAWHAWSARLRSEVAVTEMTEGVKRYFDFCQATGKIGTEYVKQAATFFGPDEHFKELWTIPVAANKQEALENRNRAIANEWARGGSNA